MKRANSIMRGTMCLLAVGVFAWCFLAPSQVAEAAYLKTSISGAQGSATAQIGTKLYSHARNFIHVIDTTSDTIVTSIPTNGGAIYGTLVGTKLYVGDGTDVMVIDTATDTVIKNIPIGTGAFLSMAVGTKLYIGSANQNVVKVIDTVTDTLSATINLGTGSTSQYRLAYANEKIYVVNTNANKVSVINPVTDTLITNITVGNHPQEMVAVGNRLYVANYLGGDVTVINALTDTVFTTLDTVNYPLSLTVSGTKIYVASVSQSSMSIINTLDTTSSNIFVGVTTRYAFTGPDNNIYVTGYATERLLKINTTTDVASILLTSGVSSTFNYYSLGVDTKLYVPGSDGSLMVFELQKPGVLTETAGAITNTTAQLTGNLFDAGADAPTVQGFEYGTTDDYGLTARVTGSYSVGLFTLPIANLACSTPYHYRAFATNIYGTTYGNDAVFTSGSTGCVPGVVTTPTTAQTDLEATLPGSIISVDPGGAARRGVDYGTSESYGMEKIEDGAFSLGDFSFDVSSLSCGTVYYYRAFAANGQGTGYGNDETFTTPNCPPVSGSSGGSGFVGILNSGSIFVCKDPKAVNYRSLGTHDSSKCVYPTEPGPLLVEIPILGESVQSVESILGSGECEAKLIVSDFMKQGDKNGKYSNYAKKTIGQINILQAHINRILAAQYEQASGPVDGIFGRLTHEGVRRLQVALNEVLKPEPLLKIDGIVGPFTRGAINNSCGKK